VVQKVLADFRGRAAGFYTREVREHGKRLGFEIVTLAGQSALLSHIDFPGPLRVGKYGVSLDNFHRVALPALEVVPGVELIVVDEVGKMECLSAQFVAAMERLWREPVPLLITVAGQRLDREVKDQTGQDFAGRHSGQPGCTPGPDSENPENCSTGGSVVPPVM
jgi:nucleoside-triphosphatase THEP1